VARGLVPLPTGDVARGQRLLPSGSGVDGATHRRNLRIVRCIDSRLTPRPAQRDREVVSREDNVLTHITWLTPVWLSCLFLAGCSQTAPEREIAPAPEASGGAVPDVVQEMVDAHGGLSKWRSAPTVSFEDALKLAGAEAPLVSRVTVEQGSRRLYTEFPEMDMRLAWDGEKAWSVDWKLPMPPRFLSNLNYYFLNLPWLAFDPGVNLEVMGRARILNDPTEYVEVQMTFDAGVGDTPDDYYYLYIDPDTKRLKATRYIVTYQALLPEGVESAPEHILVFDETTTVDGLLVPTHYMVYQLDGSLYASCSIQDWSFNRPFDESRLEMPEGATVDESTP
jgi:hypothetical protein